MNRTQQQGMNQISRLLPHLGIASDFASPSLLDERNLSLLGGANPPLLDGRNLRALTAHCVNLGGLINFFETAESPFGTWGDILLLPPELAAACLLEEASCQEQSAGINRPARITALIEDLSLSELERTTLVDTLAQEELNWQNIWIERLKKTGVSLSFPPFPKWPREQQTGEQERKQVMEQEIKLEMEQNTDVLSKAYWHDAALRIALRRSLLLESATQLWDKAIFHPEGNLAPHVGMLLAFLERYSRLQQGCNNIIPLYTSHFYKEVMGFTPRSGMVDRVLACFNAEPDMPWSTVPTGSLLTIPNMPNALTFATESSVPFSQTLLSELRAIIPTTLPGPFALSNVQMKEEKEEGEENRLWALFKNVANTDSPAIGSTLFTLPGMELAGGLRKLVFRFELEAENDAAISNLEEVWKTRPTNFTDFTDFTDFVDVTISGEGEWLSPSTLSFSLSSPRDISKKEQAEPKPELLILGVENKEKSSIIANTTKDNSNKDNKYKSDQNNSDNDKSDHDKNDNDKGSSVSVTGVSILTVSLTLEPHQSAIFPPQEDIHALVADHPVMRFTPRLIESTLWQALNAFTIKGMSVDMTIQGLQTCELTIDGDIIPNPKEGLTTIFGTEPSNGSSFVLNVPELTKKHIDCLTLYWQWEAPERFDNYFAAYPFKPISLIPAMREEDGVWHNLDTPVNFWGKLPQQLNCPVPKSGKITSWRWSLASKGSLFGQKKYPQLLAQAILNESSIFRRILANITGKTRLKELNIPLVPQWSAISINYKASLHWDVNSSQIVTHEHPWDGVYPRHSPPRLFPHYDCHSLSMEFTTGTEKDQGIPLSLYFRLQNLSPDSKDPNMRVHGADIWKDETNELTCSGIIGMTPHTTCFGENASLNKNNSLDENYSLGKNIPESFRVRFDWSDKPLFALQGIHEHAIWAVYTPTDENSLNTRSFPLPLGSLAAVEEVTAPKTSKKEIPHIFAGLAGLKVSQPYPSIGGRSQGELNVKFYYQDCAEELLHRGQAILPRDFERLILREFPDVLLALCIPHSSTDSSNFSGNFAQTSPGSVTVVILSPSEGAKIHGSVTQKNTTFTLDPYLPPYADAELMHQMTKYIDSHASPYATITLAHPVYQKVNGEIHIRCDEMKNLTEAEREIRSFLAENIAPWAFAPSTAVFDQTLDMPYLRGKLESFPWILDVGTFELNTERETTSVSYTSFTDEGIIMAGIGSLFYPGDLLITCIRSKEKHYD